MLACESSPRENQLGGLAVRRQEDGTTVLLGPVVDQAALHGVIVRIRDLGLSLLSVRLVDEKAQQHVVSKFQPL